MGGGGGGASMSTCSLIDALASGLASGVVADFRLLFSDDMLGDFIVTVVRFFVGIFVCLGVLTRTVRFLRADAVGCFIFGSSSDDGAAIKAEALQ